jgi:Ni/Co efflux regulator RcnB
VRVNRWRAGALFAPDPHRVILNNPGDFPMLKKLLVALVASAFALGAYAQAPKSDTKGDTTKTEKKAEKKTKSEKTTKKAKSEKTKADAKDATKEPKKEAKK